MRSILPLIFVLSLSGCMTGPGGARVFDPAKAMQIACSSTQVASNAADLVCQTLKGEAREKCLEYAQKASALVGAGLGLAATQIGASCKQ